MKIDIICNDGSPLEVTEKSIHGLDGRTGVGGAELALLTMCRSWHDAGHQVRLYNNPNFPDGSVFEQLPINAFNPKEDRDVVIIFRSPNVLVTPNTVGMKVWWSCDQQTVGDFTALANSVDKVVTISPNHAKYFEDNYGIKNTITIDLPVRDWEYDFSVKKLPYRCIFNSIPSRGVEPLHVAWNKIVREFPEASLVITSDWRLWSPYMTDKLLQPFKRLYAESANVTYLGAINRKELIKHELKAQLHLYPCIYDELFCISVAETQVAGALPITSDCGAVKTTNMGEIIPGDVNSLEWNKKFIETVLEYLNDSDKLERESARVQALAKERFSPKRILNEWNEKVFS